MAEKYESVLFTSPNVDVFMIPPPTGRGFKTDSWGPLASPIFTGTLRVIQTFNGEETTCDVRLEDTDSAELFASAPYVADHCVERAQDSSRYYQIRVVQDKRVAYLGIGFQERDPSFDFQVALSDFSKHVKAESEATKRKHEGVKDYSLKDGQLLNISLDGKAKSHIIAPARVDSPGVIPFLAPPPTAAEVKRSMAAQADAEDDFGDFQ